MTGRLSNGVKPPAGTLSSGPLTRVAPLPTPKMNPSSEKKLITMSPAPATVNEPVKTAWKSNRLPAPACSEFPCAMMVPVKLPFRSVVTFVNGRVLTPTPDVFPGIVPPGGLKLIVGNAWMNAGSVPAGVLKTPEPFEKKNRASIGVVEMLWTGVIQLTDALFDTAEPETAWTVSAPELAPE